MAVLMRMTWAEVTPATYEELRALVNWEGDQPPGGLAHVAAFDAAGIQVNDIWASEEALQAFLATRLMPACAKVGLTSEPDVTVLPAHAVYIPGVTH